MQVGLCELIRAAHFHVHNRTHQIEMKLKFILPQCEAKKEKRTNKTKNPKI